MTDQTKRSYLITLLTKLSWSSTSFSSSPTALLCSEFKCWLELSPSESIILPLCVNAWTTGLYGVTTSLVVGVWSTVSPGTSAEILCKDVVNQLFQSEVMLNFYEKKLKYLTAGPVVSVVFPSFLRQNGSHSPPKKQEQTFIRWIP